MSAEVFPGLLAPMPPPSSGMLVFPPPPVSVPPRFVDGLEPFVAFLEAADADPAALATDLSALWTFVAGHAEILDDPEVAEAAARFLGNAISVTHPAATWRMTPEAEVGTWTRSIPVRGLLRAMVENPEHREPFLEMFDSWEQEDRDDAELRSLTADSGGPELVVAPEPFRRPDLPRREFRDDDGRVIDYGHRWPDGPPEEAYSRVTHPERFAPLLLVVDALLEYLVVNYVTAVDRSTLPDGTQRIALHPSTGAAVTITTTAESARIDAGALFRERMPDCTCDACDETAESEADRLEETLLSIAGGGLRELFPLGSRCWALRQLRTADGGGHASSGAPDPDLAPEQLAGIEQTLSGLDDGWWPAWTLRTDAS